MKLQDKCEPTSAVDASDSQPHQHRVGISFGNGHVRGTTVDDVDDLWQEFQRLHSKKTHPVKLEAARQAWVIGVKNCPGWWGKRLVRLMLDKDKSTAKN